MNVYKHNNSVCVVEVENRAIGIGMNEYECLVGFLGVEKKNKNKRMWFCVY